MREQDGVSKLNEAVKQTKQTNKRTVSDEDGVDRVRARCSKSDVRDSDGGEKERAGLKEYCDENQDARSDGEDQVIDEDACEPFPFVATARDGPARVDDTFEAPLRWQEAALVEAERRCDGGLHGARRHRWRRQELCRSELVDENVRPQLLLAVPHFHLPSCDARSPRDRCTKQAVHESAVC